MVYSVIFKLEYHVQLLLARLSNIASDKQSSELITQDVSLSTCCWYTCVAKLFLKVFTFVTKLSKQRGSRRELGLVHLDEGTLFSSN